MARIRGKGTAPERTVGTLLRSLGYRVRMNDARLPGSPDAVVVKARAVVFVHGCYWHQHRGCRRAFVPVTEQKRWLAKFAATVRRDRRVARSLRRLGWSVLTVWECQTVPRRLPALRTRLVALLASRCDRRS